jgi:hypothetical protein
MFSDSMGLRNRLNLNVVAPREKVADRESRHHAVINNYCEHHEHHVMEMVIVH